MVFMNIPLNEGASAGHTVHLDEMLEEYYRFRGWTQDGIPTERKLRTLGLDKLGSGLLEENSYA